MSRMDGDATRRELDKLYRMHAGALWRFLARQPASFWLVNVYLLFEYVRPQQIYESIAGPPWGKFAIIGAILAFVLEGRALKFELPEKMLTLFTISVLASSMTALDSGLSFDAIWDYLGWVVIYLLIANSVTTQGRFLVFMAAYLLYNFKMSQTAMRSWASDGFTFRDWGASGAPGWFTNSGEFGIQMCVFVAVVVPFWVSLRQRWSRGIKLLFLAMGATAVGAIVASSSRGSLIGLAALALWLLLKSRHKVRALALTIVLAGGVWLIVPPEQKDRMSAIGTDKTSTARSLYWARGREAMAEHPVLGIGYKNWTSYHKRLFGYPALPHNVFLEAGAELGTVGLLGFLGLIGATLVVNARTRRIARTRGDAEAFLVAMSHGLDAALIAFVVAGSFVTVLYYPFFWINLAMTAALHRTAVSARAQPGVVIEPVRRRTPRGHVRRVPA